MKAQMIDKKLAPFNCVAILIDFQKHLPSTIDSVDVRALIENAFDLARILNSLGIPTIWTTIGAKSFGGPLLPQIQMIFSNLQPIECTTTNVWEDNRVNREVERTARQKLVVAGLWTDFSVAFSHRGNQVRIRGVCGNRCLR
jgi:nicotinamidase-related amidase